LHKVDGAHKHEDIHAVLRKYWGYEAFRPVQEDVVRSVMAGRDTLALLPTGGGKSLCFQVPALAMGRMCLVISPLIALIKDQVQRLRRMGIPARAITSDMGRAEIENALENAVHGKVPLLYVSPERLSSDLFEARLPRMPLGLIAVDEAHCISQWGYDFRPAYMQVQEMRLRVPGVPVLALTASATAQVAADIMEKLAFPAPNVIRGRFHRPELVLWVSRGEDKNGRLLRIMHHVEGSAIVYLRRRRATVQMAQFMRHHGITAEAYHAGLPPAERDRIQKEWTEGRIRCVAATNAFGMGIDKSDVRVVVHTDLPPDPESYYQEAGRAGRDGRTSFAFLLVGPGDERQLRERVAASFPPLADVRRVYQAFADMHGIALGSGLLEQYPLDLQALATRTALPLTTVAHSLKVLELDGKVALSEGARTPSRVLITASSRVVHDMRVGSPRFGPVLEALLRLYGGLYEEPALIDEGRLAKVAGLTVEKVTALLKELGRMQVISYKQRSDAPGVTLLEPRHDAQRMRIDPAALAQREQRAIERMEAMLRFVNTDRCRSRELLAYFDEPDPGDCGQCDVCRTREYRSIQADTSIVASPLTHYDGPVNAMRWMKDEGVAGTE
jgi:ATP-dependent DNA helicase RecQ